MKTAEALSGRTNNIPFWHRTGCDEWPPASHPITVSLVCSWSFSKLTTW